MRRLLTTVVVAAPLLVLASSRPLVAQEQIGIAVGATPEAVQIEDLDGNPVDLGDYIGGGVPVLLEFWATWCSLCEALEPHMLAAHAKYGDEVEFLVVAVAVNQNERRVRRYFESHEMPGRVLWDTDGRAVRAFKAPSTSYVVVLDSEGRVAYTGLGEDQDIDAAIEKALGR
jgi:cytochrome c biogenesis protein CcmG/thiol:disulfide interchange protein DsbE